MDSGDLQVLAWRLFEESNDAVFVLDPATETIQQANPAAQRLTGLWWRQLRGRRLDDLVRGDPADRTSSLLTAVRETGFFHSQEEYLLVRHNSAPLAINVSVSRVHTPSGLLRLVVARDVSERKEAERALRDFGDELASQVHRQTEELRAANTQLTREIEERKSAQRALQETNQQLRAAISQLEAARAREVKRERLHALEQIAGGIAHDINNSLAAVISFAELILKQEIPKESRRQAENIQTAGRDIAAIVRRMRQFYSDPTDQEASQAIDLVQLAEDAVQLSRPKWHDESLRLRKAIDVTVNAESSSTIVGDVSALRSVLTNLIFNAADAITSRGQITVRIAEESAMAIIDVADDGRGMTSEEQIRCLEPFYTTKTEGTGLGLSVCRGIIKAHGGQIDIDSTASKGTVVRLRIPKPAATVTPLAYEDSKAAWTEHTRPLDGKRILYVDDNNAARDSMAALLSCLGAVVDVAVDGPSGLARFDEHRYDAVVTDMTMPGMDGLQLTTEIKRQAPTMPVLLISGWLPSDMRDEAIAAKPDCVLSKPFSPHELTATLAQLLP